MDRDKQAMYDLNSLIFQADEKVYSALRFAQYMDKSNITNPNYWNACNELSKASSHISNACNLIQDVLCKEE